MAAMENCERASAREREREKQVSIKRFERDRR
jgi:hypothetical protein